MYLALNITALNAIICRLSFPPDFEHKIVNNFFPI